MSKPDYTDTQGKPADVSVNKLFLDEQNPRLRSHDAKTQGEILGVLVREMSVDEIALSIAANGYYATERLLVIDRDSGPRGTFTVIEGNRRLAAVQVLLDGKKRRSAGATGLPRLTSARRRELQTLPVSIFPGREQLWPYLGFRHVNGPREWDAFAKAQYVAMVHETYGVPIDEISNRIGDRFSTVQRMYLGYRLVRQAEDASVFDREDRYYDRRFYFSHLYTAADQPQFRKFLGITDRRASLPKPVPRSSLDKLGELLLWIYGSRSEDKDPIIQRQNPDLNLLRDSIGNEDALATIRRGVGLERASEVARGDDSVFRERLSAAKDSLIEVGSFVRLGYQGEPDLLDTARDIRNLADDLYERMVDIDPPSSGRRRRRSRRRPD